MPAVNRTIQPELPRQSGSGRVKGDYVPLLFPNGDFVFPGRVFSLFSIKYAGRTSSHTSSRREGLRRRRQAFLQTRFGLSTGKAQILLSRKRTEIERIEDVIHGVIDSFLLFDINLFVEEKYKKFINHVVRMILTMGPYGVGPIVRLWKSFTTVIYNRASGIQPQLPYPSKENFFFWGLLSTGLLDPYLNHSSLSKTDLERLAHLISTRHLPAGDKKAEIQSLDTFFKSIEEDYVFPNSSLTFVIADTARKIGSYLSTKGPIKTKPHISLSSAGSYYETVKDGGRGKEIRDALTEHLNFRPSEDESISTPFGDLHCPAGEERWRYWCRKERYSHYPTIEFGQLLTEEFFIVDGVEKNLYYQGYDEAIGNQILVVAYLEWLAWSKTGLPIPCRVLTVPEPGFKARIVTTGPFWLNVLQQGLAHQLKDALKLHPSASSGFMKTDQAWQSLYLMHNRDYPSDFACLSSDLKEATDHIPKPVALIMLSNFIEGLGLKSRLTSLCLDLIRSDRSFTSDYGHVSERQNRGVMMGEPLTKVILTLLNLTVEQAALRKYFGFRDIFPKWRTYHVGGDDHLAIGPRDYLRYITWYHTQLGSKISEGKHGISKVLVKYCEKLLDISKIYKRFDVRRINDTTETYEDSPFVDSVKLRLISPVTKSYDVHSDRNVAIGKGLSLGRTLKWLNRDHFPTKWVKMVRARFFSRMGSLLPDSSSGVYWQLHLPNHWGGLDLYMPDEVEELYSKVPELTKSIMAQILEDSKNSRENLSLLRKFLTNYSYRGYRLDETESALIKLHVERVIKQLPTMTWKEAKQEFDPSGELSAKSLSCRLHEEGFMTERESLDYMLRPVLFREILNGKGESCPYNTERLKKRYAKLWDIAYEGGSVTLNSFKDLITHRVSDIFYRVEYPEEFHFYSDRGYLFKSAIDDALNGMPKLCLDYPFT